MYIYRLTNLINGKAYVGQTIHTPKMRFQRHSSKTGSSRAIRAAISKYGKHNFKLDTLDTAKSVEELNQKEAEYIINLNTLSPNGYNLKVGGDNGYISEETKLKISLANKGRAPWCAGKKLGPISEETRAKISNALKGARGTYTEESRTRRNNALIKNQLLRRKPVTAYSICGHFRLHFISQAEAASCGFKQSEISNCCRNEFKKYTHAGFYWRYA